MADELTDEFVAAFRGAFGASATAVATGQRDAAIGAARDRWHQIVVALDRPDRPVGVETATCVRIAVATVQRG